MFLCRATRILRNERRACAHPFIPDGTLLCNDFMRWFCAIDLWGARRVLLFRSENLRRALLLVQHWLRSLLDTPFLCKCIPCLTYMSECNMQSPTWCCRFQSQMVRCRLHRNHNRSASVSCFPNRHARPTYYWYKDRQTNTQNIVVTQTELKHSVARNPVVNPHMPESEAQPSTNKPTPLQ